jgi:hypothetical protein
VKEKDGSILSRKVARQVSESSVKEVPELRGAFARVSTVVSPTRGDEKLVMGESTLDRCVAMPSSPSIAVSAVPELQSATQRKPSALLLPSLAGRGPTLLGA